MVECQLPKLEVAGSNPVIRSKNQHFEMLIFVSSNMVYILIFSFLGIGFFRAYLIFVNTKYCSNGGISC